jgi:AcrR family transcriptional regulator
MSSRERAVGDPGRRQERGLARGQERDPGPHQERDPNRTQPGDSDGRQAPDLERDESRERERLARERGQARGGDGARSFWDGYDLLWGVPTEPRAARRASLDRTMIVRAAIRIADAEGLGAVSMRRIARELQTGAMSLYRHVPDKGALISLMVDEVIGEEQIPAAPSGDWRNDLRQLADQMRALAQRHPWYPEAGAERPPVTPHGVAALDYALSTLDGYGLTIGDRVGIVVTLSTTVTALAINALAEARSRFRAQMTEDEMMSSASAYLAHIVESGKFPRFSEFMNEFMNGAKHSDPQDDALELILDGIAARLESARLGQHH